MILAIFNFHRFCAQMHQTDVSTEIDRFTRSQNLRHKGTYNFLGNGSDLYNMLHVNFQIDRRNPA